MEKSDVPELLNVREVAQLLRVTHRSICTLMAQHGLPSIRLEGKRLFVKAQLLRWLQRQTTWNPAEIQDETPSVYCQPPSGCVGKSPQRPSEGGEVGTGQGTTPEDGKRVERPIGPASAPSAFGGDGRSVCGDQQAAEATPFQTLRVREAAQPLGILYLALLSLTAPRGPIPCLRLGKVVLYLVAALKAWPAQHTRPGSPSQTQENTPSCPRSMPTDAVFCSKSC